MIRCPECGAAWVALGDLDFFLAHVEDARVGWNRKALRRARRAFHEHVYWWCHKCQNGGLAGVPA